MIGSEKKLNKLKYMDGDHAILSFLWLFKGHLSSNYFFYLLKLRLDLEHASFHSRQESINLILCDKFGNGFHDAIFGELC